MLINTRRPPQTYRSYSCNSNEALLRQKPPQRAEKLYMLLNYHSWVSGCRESGYG